MKKKTYIYSILALLSLASCQRNETDAISPVQNGEIGFTFSVQDEASTKAAADIALEATDAKGEITDLFLSESPLSSPLATKGSTTDEVYRNMNVCAFSMNGAFSGSSVLFDWTSAYETNTATDEYRLSKAMYWRSNDDYNYRFYAVSPSFGFYGDLMTSDAVSGGTVPVIAYDPSAADVDRNTADGSVDILEAISGDVVSNYNQPVPMTFKHILSGMKFSLGESSEIVLKAVTLDGIYVKGKKEIGGEWSSLETGSMTLSNQKVVSEGEGISEDDEVMFVIPQTAPEGAKLSLVFSNNGVDKTISAPIGGQELKAGYLYTVTLNQGYIIFTTDGTDVAISDANNNIFGTVSGENYKLYGVNSSFGSQATTSGEHVTEVDLSHWNPANVTNMRRFMQNLGVKTVDLSVLKNLNPEITNCTGFLRVNKYLETVDLSPLSGLTKVENLNEFMYHNFSLKEIDLTPLENLTNVRYLSYFLYGSCGNLTELDLSPLAGMTKNTNLAYFCGMRSMNFLLDSWQIDEIDLSPLAGMTKVTSLLGFLYACRGLKKVNLTPLAGMTKVISLSHFMTCSTDIEELDLSPLASMTETRILSNFLANSSASGKTPIGERLVGGAKGGFEFIRNFTNVTHLDSFCLNDGLGEFDFSVFENTGSKVVNMSCFLNANYLKEVDLSPFAGAKVRVAYEILSSNYMTTVDMSMIDFSGCTSYCGPGDDDPHGEGSSILRNCPYLEWADISNWDFSEDGAGPCRVVSNAKKDSETGQEVKTKTISWSFGGSAGTPKLKTVVSHVTKENHIAALKNCLENTHPTKTVTYVIDEEAGTVTFTLSDE